MPARGVKLAHKEQQAVTTLLAFTRLVKANLMQLKRIDRLLSNEPSEIENSSQMVFECYKIRTGQPWVKPGHDIGSSSSQHALVTFNLPAPPMDASK